MSHKHDAGQYERERSKISARAADRIAVASQRHQAVIDRLQADRKARQDSLELEAAAHQAELDHQVVRTRDHLAAAEERTCEHEQEEVQRVEEKRRALEQKAQSREQVLSHHQQTTRNLIEATQQADEAISQSRAETQERSAELKRHREDMEATMTEDMWSRTDASQVFIRDVHAQSMQRVRKAEAYRHSATMTCERMGELAQASKTTAQRAVKLNEEKAAIRAAEMTQECHNTQVQTDRAVKEQLQGSVSGLQKAREYCDRVREEMSLDTAKCSQKIREIEQAQRGKDQERELQRSALEEERKDAAKAGNKAVQDQEDRFQARRKASEAELDAVEKRLREVEQETRQRAESILEQWAAGNAAAEEAARDIERRAEQALKDMREKVAAGEQANSGQNGEIKKNGADTVSALERQANHVVDSTQPKLEATRRADEKAAAEATETLKQLKPEPGRLAAEADAEADAAMQNAAAEEQRLQQEGEAFCSTAKATMKAAHDEEKQMKVESAEAWSRLRKACHQLRLLNLHDLAQAIVDGDFDYPKPKEKVMPPLGTGLPRLVIASYT